MAAQPLPAEDEHPVALQEERQMPGAEEVGCLFVFLRVAFILIPNQIVELTMVLLPN